MKFLKAIAVAALVCAVALGAATTPTTERKISQFTNATSIPTNAYFQIVDPNETNTIDQNKRVSLTVLQDAVGGSSPTGGITSATATNINTGLMNTTARQLATNVAWVNPRSGSNTTGTNGDKLFPFATIGHAYSNSLPGSTVIVEPGNYNQQIITTNEARFEFHAGAKNLTLNVPLNPRNDGTLFQVTGNGYFYGTNVGFYAVNNSPNSFVEADSIYGVNNTLYIDSGAGFFSFDIKQPLTGASYFNRGATNKVRVPTMLGTVLADNGAKLFWRGDWGGNSSIILRNTNTVVYMDGDVDSTGLFLFGRTNAVAHTRGNWIANSDAIDFREGASGDHVGDLTSRDDAGLFVDTGGKSTVIGWVRNKSTTGNYNRQGNGAGILNGAGTNGGSATVVGGVSGINPIVNGDGTVNVRGPVIVDFNGTTPVYRVYTNEFLYTNGTQFYPADASNWIGNAYGVIGNGTATLSGGPVWSSNNVAIRMRAYTNGAPTLILENTEVGSDREWAAVIDGGRLTTRGSVKFTGGSNVTTSTYTTNTSPIYIDNQGFITWGKPKGTNFVVLGTNEMASFVDGQQLALKGSSATLWLHDRANESDRTGLYFQNGSLNGVFSSEFFNWDATTGELLLKGSVPTFSLSDRAIPSDRMKMYLQNSVFAILFTNNNLTINLTNGLVTFRDGTTIGNGHFAGLGASFNSLLVSGPQTNTGPIYVGNTLGTNGSVVSLIGKDTAGKLVETAPITNFNTISADSATIGQLAVGTQNVTRVTATNWQLATASSQGYVLAVQGDGVTIAPTNAPSGGSGGIVIGPSVKSNSSAGLPLYTLTSVPGFTNIVARQGKKFKGINLVLRPGQDWYSYYSNASFFTFITNDIALVTNTGFNTVRLISDMKAVYTNAISQSLMISRYEFFVKHAGTNGVDVYACVGDGNRYPTPPTGAELLSQSNYVFAFSAMLGSNSNVRAVDLMQEVHEWSNNLSDATNALTALFAASRAGAPSLPVSVSMNLDSASLPYDAAKMRLIKLIDSLADFNDLHIYVPPYPGNLYWLTNYTKPFVVGEIGVNDTNTPTAQTWKYRAAVALSTHPQCEGLLWWALTDQSTNSYDKWGWFTTNNVLKASNYVAVGRSAPAQRNAPWTVYIGSTEASEEQSTVNNGSSTNLATTYFRTDRSGRMEITGAMDCNPQVAGLVVLTTSLTATNGVGYSAGPGLIMIHGSTAASQRLTAGGSGEYQFTPGTYELRFTAVGLAGVTADVYAPQSNAKIRFHYDDNP